MANAFHLGAALWPEPTTAAPKRASVLLHIAANTLALAALASPNEPQPTAAVHLLVISDSSTLQALTLSGRCG